MRILLTNDDGISAEGIKALAKYFQKFHDIIIVAPNTERSASSHSITIRETLKVKKESIEGVNCDAYSVTGTPADCTKIAINEIVKERPELIISGINNGYNIGTDIFYSGTVSAAVEGTLNNIPSIAISCDGSKEGYEIACIYLHKIIEKIDFKTFGYETVLNVNIPQCHANEVKGIKVCSMGQRNYKNQYIECERTENEVVYTVKGKANDVHKEGMDVYEITQNYVTVTPLKYDLTNNELIKSFQNVIK